MHSTDRYAKKIVISSDAVLLCVFHSKCCLRVSILFLLLFLILVPRVHSTRSISIPPEPSVYCRIPEPPTNGRYSCEMNSGSGDYQTLWSGNICHINCNRFYAIPMELRRYGVIQCVRGHWNSTNVDVCQRERTQRNTLKSSKTRLNEQREPVLMPKRVRVTYNYN